jgi:hypothetical protein
MTEWLRLWHDMPTDPKWRAIARKSGQPLPCVIALFNLLMVNASANASARGTLSNWSNEDAAAALDMDEADVAAILTAMEGKVVINGALTGWDRRQPKREDGTAVERKAAWKARQNALERIGTHGNAPETDTETDTEASSLRSEAPRATDPASLPDGEPMRTQKAIADAYAKAGALPPSMHRITQWLDAGYTPAEIESTIRSVLERGKKPSTLAYFDNAIRDCRAAVQPAQGSPAVPKLSHDEQIKANIAKMTPDLWRKRIASWQRGGTWPPAWPFPNERHTPAPDAILIELGIENPRLTGPPSPVERKQGQEAHH